MKKQYNFARHLFSTLVLALFCIPVFGQVIFSDDFSSNSNGWTLGTEWGIGPTSSSGCSGCPGNDPAIDHSPSGDNGVAGVIIGGCTGSTLHGYYWLTSPVINTTTVSGTVNLQFWRHLHSDYTPFMQNAIEVYDGTNWVILWQSGPSPCINDPDWTQQSFDVTAYKNANFQVRFGHLVGNSGVYYSGSWSIDDLSISGTQAPSPIVCTLSLPNKPIDPLYAQYGANDPNTYYTGLSGSKVFIANASGGTAPYTYQWSTTSGSINAFANKPNKAQLNYPTTTSTVEVIVTDATGAACTSNVAVPVIDFTCNPPGQLWHYELCNTQTNVSSCVQGTANMRALLQTGDYYFGNCSNNPQKRGAVETISNLQVSPNPTNGMAVLSYTSQFSEKITISLVDMNGRVLQVLDLGMQQGVIEQQLDLSEMANGLYFITLTTDSSVKTEKIQLQR